MLINLSCQLSFAAPWAWKDKGFQREIHIGTLTDVIEAQVSLSLVRNGEAVAKTMLLQKLLLLLLLLVMMRVLR